MTHRIAAVLVATVLFTAPVFAAEGESTSVTKAATAPLAADVDWSMSPIRVSRSPRDSRGAALPALYISLTALNAFDAFSTTKALSSGSGVEANPLMGKATGNSAAVWAIKGAVTASTIFAAERLWKNHQRGQAIAVMLVSNGVMAVVAAQNARVLGAH